MKIQVFTVNFQNLVIFLDTYCTYCTYCTYSTYTTYCTYCTYIPTYIRMHMYTCMNSILRTYIQSHLVYLKLLLPKNLLYPTLYCESLSPLCELSAVIYPTPGLYDTFHEKQTWLDEPGPTVCAYLCTVWEFNMQKFLHYLVLMYCTYVCT